MKKYKSKFEESDFPIQLEIGKKYKTNDSGFLEILDIMIDRFHRTPPSVMITYKWYSSDGNSGTATQEMLATRKVYFE